MTLIAYTRVERRRGESCRVRVVLTRFDGDPVPRPGERVEWVVPGLPDPVDADALESRLLSTVDTAEDRRLARRIVRLVRRMIRRRASPASPGPRSAAPRLAAPAKPPGKLPTAPARKLLPAKTTAKGKGKS